MTEPQILAEVSSNETDPSFALGNSFAPRHPVLAPEALYGMAGDFVRVVEPHSEADPVALLIQFLVWFGNIVGPSPHVRVEADQHRAKLFCVLVGATARSRKGVSRGRVQEMFDRVEPRWVEDRVQSGLSSGEGVIFAVRDPVFQNGEIVDEGVIDKRLLINEGEFASTLRVLRRDGNTLSPILRNAWDGYSMQTLTKNSPTSATGSHVSIVGHITREELLRYMSETEAANGFGNRFLWLSIRRSKCLPEGGHLQPEDLDPIADRLFRAVSFARSVEQVQRSPEAREVWASVYPKLTADKPGLLGAMVARSEAQVTRLALVYALLDSSDVVRREHLQAAGALWDFCEESTKCIFGDQLGDPIADDILRALRRTGADGLTRTEINQHLGRHRRRTEISRALGRLADAGVASFEKVPTDGRSREIWRAKEVPKAKEGSTNGRLREVWGAKEVPKAKEGGGNE